MDVETAREIMRLRQMIERLTLPELGAQPVFLDDDDNWTHTDFDGDSFSDVGAHTKIENTGWSSTIPANAKAIIIRGAIRDSGSAAAATCRLQLFSSSTATYAALEISCAGIANDGVAGGQGTVPCTDGDVWYRIEASGANTMDVWLQVVGYYL